MSRLFQKNKKTTIAELEEYYANQESKKNSTAKAWFMAFISLLVTLLVIAGLFMAGRWLYRSLTDKPSDTTSTESSQADQTELPTFDSDNGVIGQGNPADTSTESSQGTVSDEAASTSIPNNTNNQVVTDVAIGGVATENTPTQVPNTGAGDMLVAVPIVVAISGYIVARKYFLKRF